MKTYKHTDFTSTGTGAAYGDWQGFEHCHTSPSEVMTIGEAKVYAGRWIEMEKDLDWDLRIRLNDMWAMRGASPAIVMADPQAKALMGPELTEPKYPPTINIDWDDYDAPQLKREWWVRLVAKLKTLGPVAVCVYCQGGHGRTGTALAILAGLSEQELGSDDVVGWVRHHYCKEAVESYAQIDYIQDMLGEEIFSDPTSVLKSRKKAFQTTFQQPGVVTTTYQEDGNKPVTAENSLFAAGSTKEAKNIVKMLSKQQRKEQRKNGKA